MRHYTSFSVINIISIISRRGGRDGVRPQLISSSGSEIDGLGEHHVEVLVALAEAIDDPNDGVVARYLQDRMQHSGYRRVAVTLGLKALLQRELAVLREEEDYNGNTYRLYGITDDGFRWLADNEDKIRLKEDETNRKERSAMGVEEDDVPF